MRADGGRVALCDRHLDRLEGSARALGWGPMPERRRMEAAVAAVAEALAPGSGRVRLTATARPTLVVEGTPEPPLGREPATVRAVAVRGAWCPDATLAEHKTLSYAAFRIAQRRAEREGADHALLLDARGALGEAATASAICAVGGRLVCAPARGLLPGIARAAVLAALDVEERPVDEAAWRSADEIILPNAVRGAMAVVAVDGAPVGEGAAGPLARSVHEVLRGALRGR
jgi:branched-subunit amino acid aminotransferase/4-amino-4-deoxychorismate lyase